MVWAGGLNKPFLLGGGDRKELERDIYVKIDKWLGLTGQIKTQENRSKL